MGNRNLDGRGLARAPPRPLDDETLPVTDRPYEARREHGSTSEFLQKPQREQTQTSKPQSVRERGHEGALRVRMYSMDVPGNIASNCDTPRDKSQSYLLFSFHFSRMSIL